MDKFAFDTINTYCNSRNKTISQIERDYVIRRFSENLFSSIERKKQTNNNQPLTQQELDDIRDTLLDEGSLDTLVIAAGNYYDDIKARFHNDYKKDYRLKDFWLSVLVGTVANVIYSLVIIVLFFIAKDQISSWITSLGIEKVN